MGQEFILNIRNQSKIYVGSGSQMLSELLSSKSRVIIISDVNIDRIYGDKMPEGCDKILIGVGETAKTLLTIENIVRKLIELGADRSTFLLGIGGGIVSDITGFVAAIYMRGVEFGFVSTTLLSQVDAGVGGKNGVNFDGFKNMIGTFLQPQFVICDVDMLSSLSLKEFRSGIAEIIKAAIIDSPSLFELLEQSSVESLRSDVDTLSKIIFESISIKARVVDLDERESGVRRKLNLGHTFAHAIEKGSTEMNHGEAVAVGTLLSAEMSQRMGLMSATDLLRVRSLLERYGFELESPVPMVKMLKLMKHDKKASGDYINMVLPTQIGMCEVRKMSINEISECNGI